MVSSARLCVCTCGVLVCVQVCLCMHVCVSVLGRHQKPLILRFFGGN